MHSILSMPTGACFRCAVVEQTKDGIEGFIEEALKASRAATDSILDMPMDKVRLATLEYCHEPGLFSQHYCI